MSDPLTQERSRAGRCPV
uniref:Uncharacterized protein n=1 Tax=Anguilla anguilla TaxID=7936 RepID=A0A0E9TRX9_ANGAN